MSNHFDYLKLISIENIFQAWSEFRKRKAKYYIRYADDFLFMSGYKTTLQRNLVLIAGFLKDNLKLELHPTKINIRRLDNGINFLGYIILPHYILPRTKTKRRIFKKLSIKLQGMNKGVISEESFSQSMQSHLGYLSHASAFKLAQKKT